MKANTIASRARRHLALAAVAMAALAMPALPPAAAAEPAYPAKPIRLLVGYPPGGGTDILARLISPRLGELLGQPVVIENRAGASGTIAANVVAKAAPDGYTLLLGNNSSNAAVGAVNTELPYDLRGDFTPVALIASAPHVVAVPADSRFTTLAELIAYARANPEKLSYGTPGVGSAPHLAGQLFESLTGTRLLHVPYRGAGSAIADMIGGRTQVSFDSASTVLGQLKGGTVRPLAVASNRRMPQLGEIPTTAEAGTPNYVMSVWFGLFGPAGLPAPVVERLSAAMDRVLTDPQLGPQVVATMGAEPLQPASPAEFARFVDAEIERYAAFAGKAGAPAR